ncbi:hypothetical protein PBY51_015613 [Eleginops maclovinus]|uniref:Uncharacterized protein n=1 Tax=Eleginops maclovinus TaxID=56733 RepID=A0AAN7XPT8_ELEMC|nr:hypothetical protein PBY51_015613 [Eleginops maclovinus]
MTKMRGSRGILGNKLGWKKERRKYKELDQEKGVSKCGRRRNVKRGEEGLRKDKKGVAKEKQEMGGGKCSKDEEKRNV